MMKRQAHNKLTQEDVIKAFIEVHGDTFDYSNVVYINTNTPIELHKKFKEYKYKPNFWFAGHTECYTKDLPIETLFNF